MPSAYDPETNTMYVNQTGPDFDQVLQNVGHEFAHEMFNELFGSMYDTESDEGASAFNDESEDFAGSEQDGYAADLEDECEGDFVESPGKSDSPQGDWNLPPESYG